ncbi:MAG: hypothetical protein Q8S13_13335 [Dehalococcoidia bacterium]|nr:hypothetical protein [Dehalococcoidia bacterium]
MPRRLSAAEQRARRAARIAAGGCIACRKDAEPGKQWCAEHVEARRAQGRAHAAKLRGGRPARVHLCSGCGKAGHNRASCATPAGRCRCGGELEMRGWHRMSDEDAVGCDMEAGEQPTLFRLHCIACDEWSVSADPNGSDAACIDVGPDIGTEGGWNEKRAP